MKRLNFKRAAREATYALTAFIASVATLAALAQFPDAKGASGVAFGLAVLSALGTPLAFVDGLLREGERASGDPFRGDNPGLWPLAPGPFPYVAPYGGVASDPRAGIATEQYPTVKSKRARKATGDTGGTK